MNIYHTSVLLHETIDLLQVKAGKRYIDGTLGGGGHTFEILKHRGLVLGLDVDDDALNYVTEKIKEADHKAWKDALTVVKGNFKDIDTIAREHAFGSVSGIILDVGISSHHVEIPERGFSFQHEGPLDMRMDKALPVNAKDLINGLTKRELYDLFTILGEEWNARAIVASILAAREIKQIETTTELASIIKTAVPYTKKGVNPATKVFQALRIAVNDELNNLIAALPKALTLLEQGGRLNVISFHSLEDRIVKRTFLEFAEKNLGTIITKKPIVPTEKEIVGNSRARSAKLRVFEKI